MPCQPRRHADCWPPPIRGPSPPSCTSPADRDRRQPRTNSRSWRCLGFGVRGRRVGRLSGMPLGVHADKRPVPRALGCQTRMRGLSRAAGAQCAAGKALILVSRARPAEGWPTARQRSPRVAADVHAEGRVLMRSAAHNGPFAPGDIQSLIGAPLQCPPVDQAPTDAVLAEVHGCATIQPARRMWHSVYDQEARTVSVRIQFDDEQVDADARTPGLTGSLTLALPSHGRRGRASSGD